MCSLAAAVTEADPNSSVAVFVFVLVSMAAPFIRVTKKKLRPIEDSFGPQ
jgi:hypothetical protein